MTNIFSVAHIVSLLIVGHHIQVFSVQPFYLNSARQ